jgi:hypothetical protein
MNRTTYRWEGPHATVQLDAWKKRRHDRRIEWTREWARLVPRWKVFPLFKFRVFRVFGGPDVLLEFAPATVYARAK